MFKILSIQSKPPVFTEKSLVSEGLEKVDPVLIIHPRSFFSFLQFIEKGQYFYQLNHLEILDLKIPTQKVSILSFLLENMTRLLYLSLANTDLEDKTTKAIIDGLPTSLVVLDLSYNHIESGICFSGDQKIWRYLRNLDLSGNKIKNLGLIDLLDTLKLQPFISLRGLYLKKTEIGDGDIKTLSQQLTILMSLTSLDLSRNQIGDQGAMILCDTMSSLTALHRLMIKKNLIHKRYRVLLIQEAFKMPTLKLDIDIDIKTKSVFSK